MHLFGLIFYFIKFHISRDSLMYKITIDEVLCIKSHGLEMDFKIMLCLEINLTKYMGSFLKDVSICVNVG